VSAIPASALGSSALDLELELHGALTVSAIRTPT
jgi:hypothetical protein